MTKHHPRKRFGQNFLRDPNIIARLVDFIAPAPTDNLIEIGPGRGALTLPLLRAAGQMSAIELDRDLIPYLEELAEPIGKLAIHQCDILKFDLASLGCPEHPMRIVGNLPYNISTPILFHLAQYRPITRDIHIMLQLEVIERMAAQPGTKAYGRLSVMAQYHWNIKPLYRIGSHAFFPPPKIESAFARLIPHQQPPVDVGSYETFSKLVRTAFSARRKTLRNSLKTLLSAEQISGCNIDPQRRPETLSLPEYAALSRILTCCEN